ncbi:MAG: LysM peptidoglycan-binding domain-containing protein [Gammaproteobacteria bacterium]|nr:LysM peptidoglycan-binding domain-containing protein [Gammaproteobacteria bacterium]MBU1724913.1 LysM peptidoglycan-binding domain-containing protein [Gammaproteobacteria bacterium]MBU2004883.1 LysM peptidoglycan-binding domain-containing protein [Gammaproteobacteria bacterium]
MSEVQAGSGAEAQALEAAGKVVDDVIEANRQLIEGAGEDKSPDRQNIPASSLVINMEKVAGEQRHVVKNGESLSLIARQYYKDGLKYWKIYQANQELLSNPDIILEGQELKIPE